MDGWIDTMGTSKAEIGSVCVTGGMKDSERGGKDNTAASGVVDGVAVVDGGSSSRNVLAPLPYFLLRSRVIGPGISDIMNFKKLLNTMNMI